MYDFMTHSYNPGNLATRSDGGSHRRDRRAQLSRGSIDYRQV